MGGHAYGGCENWVSSTHARYAAAGQRGGRDIDVEV